MIRENINRKNTFEIFFKFLGWHCLSFGIHIDPVAPKIEFHIPFGWIGIGWMVTTTSSGSWEDGCFYLIKSRI